MSSAVGIDVEKAASLLFEVEAAVEKDYTDLGKTGIVDIVELLDTWNLAYPYFSLFDFIQLIFFHCSSFQTFC